MIVGIIGAGTMGSGIAQAFAQVEGYSVRLCDLEKSIADRGKAQIVSRLGKRVEKGAITAEDADRIASRISTGVLDSAAGCDLVVEAAIEVMDIKKKLFAQIAAVCDESTLLATNTSSLSVTELSSAIGRPVLGMHFFNPAPAMKLVEVVAGAGVGQDLVDRVMAIATEIGKTPVQVQEAAGFVVNRILIPMVNEAIGLLAEGTASAEDIDIAMKLGAGHSLGPLATGDLVGLDVILAIMEVLQSETGDPKYRPHPLLRQYVRAGTLGRKSGSGIFDYSA